MSRSGFGMAKVVLAIAVVASLTALAGYFYFLRGENEKSSASSASAHFYNDPKTSIAEIGLKVFYAVPKNHEKDFDRGWRGTIDAALLKASRFHALQLRGFSKLNYEIFPRPFFLENEDIFYNSTSTDRGNPRGLIAIAEEVDRRVFRKSGDLYNQEFAKFKDGEYPVMGLIYEGVGASGGVIYETDKELTQEEIAKRLGVPESIVFIVDVESSRGFFLLNHEFLREKMLSVLGPTYLYHELAHSFGLPDREEGGGAAQGNDIMGYGRRESIEVMYIGKDLLKGLGIIN